ITPIHTTIDDAPALRTASRRSGELTTVTNNAIDSHSEAVSGGLLLGANWASSPIDDLQYCEQARCGVLLVVDLRLAVVQPGALHGIGSHVSLRFARVDLASHQLAGGAAGALCQHVAVGAQSWVTTAGAPQRAECLGHRADTGTEGLVAARELREP